jgi:dTDP-glucose pyrophosphorylase
MFSKYLINENDLISSAISKLKKVKNKILVVINNKKKVVGVLTSGDIYKNFLEFKPNQVKISKIMNTKFYYLENEKDLFKKYFKNYSPRILHVPILKKKKLTKILFYEDILKIISRNIDNKYNYSAIIMAGGLGKRMGSLLKKTPKPLVKDKNKKPVIINLVRKLIKYKFNKIFISLFYEKEIIEKKMKEEFNNKLFFIRENKRTGTIGSISKLPVDNRKNLFITNCDTQINFNPTVAVKFHTESKNDITIIVSNNEISSNYGLVNLNKFGRVNSIIEKPINEILVNTGMYVVSEKVFKLIKKNKFIDADELINLSIEKNLKIKAFPIREEMWTDIGTKRKYLSYLSK